MEYVDYIIVGDGYAALFFAHQLIKNQKSFRIFSDGNKSASQVSAGMINPVVLKKFTTFWKAHEQIDYLKNSLREIQAYTGKNYLIDAPIHRIFHDENEQQLWLRKAETEELSHFLDKDFKFLDILNNPFGTGKVNQSARLDVKGFFNDLFTFFEEKSYLIKEKFIYEELNILESSYKGIGFNHIIFCEGMDVKNNPFFSQIPVNANKGHHIKVKLSKPLAKEITVKKKHFLFPVDEDRYFYGGTYDREQLHHHIDDTAVQQLQKGLSEFYPFDFEIDETHFGFRPTVKDRRPIVGRHETHKNLYVFNGLGARGILNGCYFSVSLYNLIENGISLPEEVDLTRFKK